VTRVAIGLLNQFSNSSISDSLVVAVVALFPRRFLVHTRDVYFLKTAIAWVAMTRNNNARQRIACDSERIAGNRAAAAAAATIPRASRARPPSFSLTSGCLIGVETNGVTGTHTPCAGSVARMPECLNPAPAVRRRIRHRWCVTTAKPGNYPRHATSYVRTCVPRRWVYDLRAHRVLPPAPRLLLLLTMAVRTRGDFRSRLFTVASDFLSVTWVSHSDM